MEKKRICLNCGYELRGRADQKYCSDACRNAHHNNSRNNATEFMRNINKTLRKNRSILEKRCPYDKAKSKKEQLSADGFNFNYHTNIYRTKKGQDYIFCYNYGYLKLNDEDIIIVKRKDYVE